MVGLKLYSGSCHCGCIAFDLDLDVSEAPKCNCTICAKLGAVWAYASKTKFTLTSCEAKQGHYQFAKKHLHHRFCTACGVESYAEDTAPDGTAAVGINLRCIEAINVDKLSPRPWDGRSK